MLIWHPDWFLLIGSDYCYSHVHIIDMCDYRNMVTRKRTSLVWNYFELSVEDSEKKGKKFVKCKIYDSKLVDGGGTGNLFSHLESKHLDEYNKLKKVKKEVLDKNKCH